jgi:hypothetical protein
VMVRLHRQGLPQVPGVDAAAADVSGEDAGVDLAVTAISAAASPRRPAAHRSPTLDASQFGADEQAKVAAFKGFEGVHPGLVEDDQRSAAAGQRSGPLWATTGLGMAICRVHARPVRLIIDAERVMVPAPRLFCVAPAGGAPRSRCPARTRRAGQRCPAREYPAEPIPTDFSW